MMPPYSQTTELLSYEGSSCPLVRRTGRGEFLLNTGSFGIVAFVATGGSNVTWVFYSGILYFTNCMTQRPPVDWRTSPPKSVSYIFPYVVAWSQVTGNIHVYNLLDQKCVQEISFQVSKQNEIHGWYVHGGGLFD